MATSFCRWRWKLRVNNSVIISQECCLKLLDKVFLLLSEVFCNKENNIDVLLQLVSEGVFRRAEVASLITPPSQQTIRAWAAEFLDYVRHSIRLLDCLNFFCNVEFENYGPRFREIFQNLGTNPDCNSTIGFVEVVPIEVISDSNVNGSNAVNHRAADATTEVAGSQGGPRQVDFEARGRLLPTEPVATNVPAKWTNPLTKVISMEVWVLVLFLSVVSVIVASFTGLAVYLIWGNDQKNLDSQKQVMDKILAHLNSSSLSSLYNMQVPSSPDTITILQDHNNTKPNSSNRYFDVTTNYSSTTLGVSHASNDSLRLDLAATTPSQLYTLTNSTNLVSDELFDYDKNSTTPNSPLIATDDSPPYEVECGPEFNATDTILSLHVINPDQEIALSNCIGLKTAEQLHISGQPLVTLIHEALQQGNQLSHLKLSGNGMCVVNAGRLGMVDSLPEITLANLTTLEISGFTDPRTNCKELLTLPASKALFPSLKVLSLDDINITERNKVELIRIAYVAQGHLRRLHMYNVNLSCKFFDLNFPPLNLTSFHFYVTDPFSKFAVDSLLEFLFAAVQIGEVHTNVFVHEKNIGTVLTELRRLKVRDLELTLGLNDNKTKLSVHFLREMRHLTRCKLVLLSSQKLEAGEVFRLEGFETLRVTLARLTVTANFKFQDIRAADARCRSYERKYNPDGSEMLRLDRCSNCVLGACVTTDLADRSDS